jgi:hypothetical protein
MDLRNGDDYMAGAGSPIGRGYRPSVHVVVAAGSSRRERPGCLKIVVQMRSGFGVVESTDEWPCAISLSALNVSEVRELWAIRKRSSLRDDVDALPKSTGTIEGRHRDMVLA